MEEKLVALISHLVYSGLEVETALTLAHEYAFGHYLQALSFIPVFPREAERIRNQAQEAASSAVAKAVRKAWIATEQLRKAEEEPPKKNYTQDEVMMILKPFVLKELL